VNTATSIDGEQTGVVQKLVLKYTLIVSKIYMQAIRRDPNINWICRSVMKHREMRGLTAAGRRSRGLGKGHGYSKTIGGSRRKCWKRQNTLKVCGTLIDYENNCHCLAVVTYLFILPVSNYHWVNNILITDVSQLHQFFSASRKLLLVRRALKIRSLILH